MNKLLKLFAGTALVAVIVGSVYGVVNRQDIYDSIVLRNYQPPTRVAQLADNTTMTDATRRVFYVNQPEIDGKDKFKSECQASEQSIVLGCYVSNNGIFLLDVNDPRLLGVMEVTSAHEVLHAQYERLSKSEKEEVDRLTSDFAKTITDQRLLTTIENYRKKDAGVVPNELHSILGSEVKDLPPELETYYSKYFRDRKAVVAYSAQYEQVFTDLKVEQDRYVVRLDEIKAEFSAKLAQLNTLEAQRAKFKQDLDSLRSSDRIAEYNGRVDEYNQLVSQRNSLVPTLKSLSAESEDIVNKYNSSVGIYQELIQSIDANSVPKSVGE